MKVWLSTIGQRLDDAENTRTMLLARYLMARGHDVTLWTSAYDHIRKEWRQEWLASKTGYTMPDGLHVRFMKGSGYTRNISLKRFRDHILAARDFRAQAVLQDAPDIVVASIPDHFTAAAMIAYAQENNLPALIDVRDKWPDIFVDYAPSFAKVFVKIALTFESRRARRALRGADALVAMMNSMLHWGVGKADRAITPDDKVFYLSTMQAADTSSAPLDDLDQAKQDILAQIKGKTVFSFAGTFNKTQHPLLVLDALDILAQDPNVDISHIAVLIGGDGQDADEVRRRIDLSPAAYYLGWLKPQEMRAILVRSDVGLLPMNFPSPAFNNKAFAYLACGIPILNCALGDLADLIKEDGIGMNVQAGQADKLATAMADLIHNSAQVAEMKQRVKALYAASFDQDKTYNAYVDHVEMIAARRN